MVPPADGVAQTGGVTDLERRSPTQVRASLHADCARCAALCCVALPFARSADFAFDKPPGTPCRNLLQDFRCGIHEELRERGFAGCTVFECHGAGQQVIQVTFGGRSWRDDPASAPDQFAVFYVMRQLHDLLWYLTEALALVEPLRGSEPIARDLRAGLYATDALTQADAGTILSLDVDAHRTVVNDALVRASALVRRSDDGDAPFDGRGADLVGRDLRRTDLRRASLRGAALVGAVLRGVDLGLADLTGADLRGADVAGADLSHALFVTQPQLDAARGDAGTGIPADRYRPRHWPAA